MHFLRNVLAQVPKGSQEMVAAAIRTIFAQPDAEHVREQFEQIATMIGRQLPKVAAIREMIDARGLAVDLEIDGGITQETAPEAIAAGARVLVAGNAIFREKDRAAAIAALRCTGSR